MIYSNHMVRISAALLTLTFLLMLPIHGDAQSYLEKFGKNRVQTEVFKWKYFDTEHFKIYHYDRSGRELARYVSEQVENDIDMIERKIGGKFPRKFKIVLYNSYDDYLQTNIGKKNEGQLQDVPAGTVDIVGDKMVVYYTGVHTDLRRQTRAGMARVIMERMLFGESIGEVVRNAVLVNLPEWTVNGFIAYIVDGWDSRSNSVWRSMVEGYPEGADFHVLAQRDPELAGKAFWKFISDQYGEHDMKQLVYNAQLKSSLNLAIKTTLGVKSKVVFDSVIHFYEDVYALDAKDRDKPDSATALIEIDIPKDGSVLRDIRVAPRGRDVAYVVWKDGEYQVKIQKTQNSQVASTVLSRGKLDYGAAPDQNYPIITWSNTGYKLAILYIEDGKTMLRIYNSLKIRIENYEIPENRFDRVLSMTFMEDDERLIFSAIKDSQTDLYEFSIRGKRMTNITDDPWDDLQPWYVSGGSRRGILFISNRTAPNIEVPMKVNELPTGSMNVYFYNTTTKRKELLQMTHYKKGDVSQPIQYGSEDYAYLYDDNGVVNQYIIKLKNDQNNMDSAYSIPVTNYATNIVNHQYNPVSNQVADVLRDGDKYKVYYKPLLDTKKKITPKEHPQTLLKQSETKKKKSVLTNNADVSKKDEVAKEPVMKKGNAFQTDFGKEDYNKTRRAEKKAEQIKQQDEEVAAAEAEDAASESAPDSTYLNMRAYKYQLAFKPDALTVRLDNSILFNKYQAASQNGNQFVNPSLAGLITVSLDDLLEDYKITGGFRLPINFRGTTYFLQFDNNKRRVDWSLIYLRNTTKQTYNVIYPLVGGGALLNEQFGKTATDLVQGTVSYPFNKFESVKLHLGLRSDVLHFKAQDTFSLSIPAPDNKKYWLMSRAEYIFDNTSNPTINIFRGFRYKFFGEYMLRLNGNGGGFYNLGTDFRYYKKIHKHATWAIRFAAAHSGGNMKILYFAGGVDNQIRPKYANDIPLRVEDYAFQTLATSMRGYEQNSWNGNSFGILNTEFRIPVITTFTNRPIQSSILRNLQFVPFADLGSAWAGLWPTEGNIHVDKTFPDRSKGTIPTNNNVIVVLEDQRSLFGLGYGVGLRTMLLGYFLRFDCAWNTDNHRKTPLLHFSMGTDF